MVIFQVRRKLNVGFCMYIDLILWCVFLGMTNAQLVDSIGDERLKEIFIGMMQDGSKC